MSSYNTSEPNDDGHTFVPGIGMVPSRPGRHHFPPIDRSRPYRPRETALFRPIPLQQIVRYSPSQPTTRDNTPLFVKNDRPHQGDNEVDRLPYHDSYRPSRPQVKLEDAEHLLRSFCPGALGIVPECQLPQGDSNSLLRAGSRQPARQSRTPPTLRDRGGGSPSGPLDSSDVDKGFHDNDHGRPRRGPPRRRSRSPGFPYQSSTDKRRWLRDREDGQDHYRYRKPRLEADAFRRDACIHPDRDKITKKKLGQVLTAKDPWIIFESRRQPPATCICAISRHCPGIPEDRIDHRTYAPNPKSRRPRRQGGWNNVDEIDPCDPRHRSLRTSVQYFGRLAEDIYGNVPNVDRVHTYLRNWISKMRVFDMRPVLRASGILCLLNHFIRWANNSGINHRQVPLDIYYDLEWLLRRWEFPNGIDLDLTNCVRRIKDDRIVCSLVKDPTCKRTANDWGHNGIVPGECWPYQLCLVRDGAHGAPEAGIYGVKGQGAVSLILSDPKHRDDYADIDHGAIIDYVSTASRTNSPTACTQLLLDAERNAKRIRVFRGWQMVMHNKYRPVDGFRYDGLHTIRSHEILDESNALYRFRLERVSEEEQGPIRTDRPDLREVQQFRWARLAMKRSQRLVRKSRRLGASRGALAVPIPVAVDEDGDGNEGGVDRGNDNDSDH